MTSDEKQAGTDYSLVPSFFLYCHGSKKRNAERGWLWETTVSSRPSAKHQEVLTIVQTLLRGNRGYRKTPKIKTELEKNKDHAFVFKLRSGAPGTWYSITRLETLLTLINKHLE